MRSTGLLAALAVVVASCRPSGGSAPPSVPEPEPIVAAPASGDFRWTIGDATHLLRAGAATIGEGGWLEIVLADGDGDDPCASTASADDLAGPSRVHVAVPRGLDEAWPVGRAVSPAPLEVLPRVPSRIRVARYALELESVEAKPGGRVVGRLAWIAHPSSAAALPRTLGEGRFDVPLCATQSALDALPKPVATNPAGPVKGRTINGALAGTRALAELVPAEGGGPPYVSRVELYPDPLITCATREVSKGTAIVVGIDPVTGLGERLQSRQPVFAVTCDAGKLAWECLGGPRAIRGFVELSAVEPRVGGAVRGAIAIEGAKGSGLAGAFEAEVCPP